MLHPPCARLHQNKSVSFFLTFLARVSCSRHFRSHLTPLFSICRALCLTTASARSLISSALCPDCYLDVQPFSLFRFLSFFFCSLLFLRHTGPSYAVPAATAAARRSAAAATHGALPWQCPAPTAPAYGPTSPPSPAVGVGLMQSTDHRRPDWPQRDEGHTSHRGAAVWQFCPVPATQRSCLCNSLCVR